MKTRSDLRWAAFGLAAASLATGDDDPVALSFTPESGSSRAVTMRAEHVLDGGELAVVMSGSPVPDMYLPDLYLEMTDTVSLEIVDSFAKSGAGGPTEWVRRYESAGRTNEGNMTVSMMDGSEEENPWFAEAETELSGSVVRFWQDGADTGRELVEGVDGDWVEELRASFGFASLLPEEPVASGDTWNLEDDFLAMLIEPAGELGLAFDGEAAEYLESRHESEELSGDVELTLRSVEDGRATIVVDGEIVRVRIGPGDLSQVPVVDGTATDTTTDTFEVGGELVWDVDANALVDLQLEGALMSETLTERDEGQPGPTYESTFTVEGSWSVSVECRAEGTELAEAAAAR